jgi:hypothetical protein
VHHAYVVEENHVAAAGRDAPCYGLACGVKGVDGFGLGGSERWEGAGSGPACCAEEAGAGGLDCEVAGGEGEEEGAEVVGGVVSGTRERRSVST